MFQRTTILFLFKYPGVFRGVFEKKKNSSFARYLCQHGDEWLLSPDHGEAPGHQLGPDGVNNGSLVLALFELPLVVFFYLVVMHDGRLGRAGKIHFHLLVSQFGYPVFPAYGSTGGELEGGHAAIASEFPVILEPGKVTR